jgi:hypothetical protein
MVVNVGGEKKNCGQKKNQVKKKKRTKWWLKKGSERNI